jgi:hypothetical protein
VSPAPLARITPGGQTEVLAPRTQAVELVDANAQATGFAASVEITLRAIGPGQVAVELGATGEACVAGGACTWSGTDAAPLRVAIVTGAAPASPIDTEPATMASLASGLATPSPETEAGGQAPAATDFITADPAECTTTPRTVEEVAALAAAPDQASAQALAAAVATPGLDLPAGPAADAATVAAVVATFRQFNACLNAGQPLAADALWTDEALRQSVVQAPDTTPTPVPAAERIAFRVGPVRVLADGRVAAVVEQRFPLFADATVYLLVSQNGRYLIDETRDMDLASAP